MIDSPTASKRSVEFVETLSFVRVGESVISDRHSLLGQMFHSHSIVPGGLLVMSNTQRFTPFTSLMMRLASFSSNP